MKTTLILICMALAGCSTTSYKDPVEVLVPVATQCPKPADLVPVVPLVKQLTEADKKRPGYVAQMYRATVIQLEGEIRARDVLLDAYR